MLCTSVPTLVAAQSVVHVYSHVPRIGTENEDLRGDYVVFFVFLLDFPRCRQAPRLRVDTYIII